MRLVCILTTVWGITGNQHTALWSYGSIFFQTELVAENYSKSPARAIGKEI